MQSAYQDSLEEFKSHEGEKIQMITAFRGKINIEQFLAEKGDSIITNFGPGKTPLHVAALYGNVELLKALLSNDPGMLTTGMETFLSIMQLKWDISLW